MGQSCVAEAISCVEEEGILAESFLGNMRGGSGGALVQASDGHSYVVKSINNEQGPNIPFNEALGSLLASNLGLPVPFWSPVIIPESFIEQNLGAWRGCSTDRPQPGLYYGSEYIGSSSTRSVYQLIPPDWVENVANRLDFLGILVFDIWTENLDKRQALFVRSQGSETLHAVFIDQGHCFRGPHGNRPLYTDWACLYRLRDVYNEVATSKNIAIWTRWVNDLDADIINSMISRIPDEWKSGIDTQAVVQRLIRGRKGLSERVEWAKRMLTRQMNPSQQEKKPRWLKWANATM